jgi:putative inorganic carbon (HCO3(-)) transporter
MDFEKAVGKIIEFGFYALFFIVPLIFIKGHVELFQFNKMMTVYFGTTIITTAWLIKMILQKRFFVRRTPLDIPILLFLSSQILSTIFSIEPHTSLWGYYSRFHQGLFSTISYILLYYAFVSNTEKARAANFASRLGQAFSLASQAVKQKHRTRTVSGQKIVAARATFSQISFPPFVKNSILTLLASATIVSLYGILEHFGIDEHLWVQDVRNRVFSTLGQPNWLAAFLVTITPLSFIIPNFLYKSKKLKPKSYKLYTFSYLVFAIFYLTLLYTKSRSGLLGFAVMYLTFWTLTFISLRQVQNLTSHFLKTTAIIAIVTFLVGTRYTPSLSDLYKKIKPQPETTPAAQVQTPQPTPPPIPGGTESADIRKIVWKGAIEVWKNWPILGSGVETFAYSYYNFRPIEHNFVSEWDFLYNKAHNEYLNFLATTGLFGLGSYLLLQIWYAIWTLKTIIKVKSGVNKFAQGATARLKAWLANYFTKDSRNQTFATKQISVDVAQNTFLIALLSGLAGLSVANFFGFSTVTPGLLFFTLPAFAVVTAETKSHWIILHLGTKKQKNKSTSLQIISLIIVLLLCLYLLTQLGKRWYADRLFAKGTKLSDANQISEALILMQKASTLVPDEPLFHDRLALDLARSAVALYLSNDATSAAQLAQVAAAHSDLTIIQNPVNLNYLKNRAATILHLANIDPRYKEYALEALLRCAELAPTDPKIPYNLGLFYTQQNQLDKAMEEFQKAINLRPDYDLPRLALAVAFEEQGKIDKAIEQYQTLLKLYPKNPTAQNALQRLATSSGSRQ